MYIRIGRRRIVCKERKEKDCLQDRTEKDYIKG